MGLFDLFRSKKKLSSKTEKNTNVDNTIIRERIGYVSESFTDKRDGKIYKTVKIGKQIWMAENLAYEIPGKKITDRNAWEYDHPANDGGWCYYGNGAANGRKYGVLYQFEAAKAACPTDWHLPTDDEWDELENYLSNNGYNYDGAIGGSRDRIARYLEPVSGWKGTSGGSFVGENQAANNKSGFTALLGGFRCCTAQFHDIGFNSIWWSSFYDSPSYRGLRFQASDFYGNDYYGGYGFSLRCVKD